jgi:hypothetical protein
MKKIICTIFIMFLLLAVTVPPVVAADKENFTVTNLTVLGKIAGAGYDVFTKSMAGTADWVMSRAQALCNILIVTGSPSGQSIIAPAEKRMYIVRNSGGSGAVIIKKSGGSGVSIASGKTAIVIWSGSDYVRVTEDATN